MRRRIRNQDIFGSAVSLNFNRQGNTFQTTFGAFLSIAINAFMLVLFIYKIDLMLKR